MSVRCGNTEFHGTYGRVYHTDASEVYACFNGLEIDAVTAMWDTACATANGIEPEPRKRVENRNHLRDEYYRNLGS